MKQESGFTLEEAADVFGSKAGLAVAIGMAPHTVRLWGERIPPSRVQSVRLACQDRIRKLAQKFDMEVK